MSTAIIGFRAPGGGTVYRSVVTAGKRGRTIRGSLTRPPSASQVAFEYERFLRHAHLLEGLLYYNEDNTISQSGVLALHSIETVDLISEGEIQGLATGEYGYSGTAYSVGWDSAEFSGYCGAITDDGLSGSQWLRSIYWNDMPVVDNAGRLNFANIDATYTIGEPDGSLLDANNTELSFTRSIQEPLYASKFGADGIPTSFDLDYIKKYRILNRNCKAVVVNINIAGLYTSITQTEAEKEGNEAFEIGDVVADLLEYMIFYRPIFSTATTTPTSFEKYVGTDSDPLGVISIKGKITQGFIKSTRIELLESIDENTSVNIKRDDFLGWEIRIARKTPDSYSNYKVNKAYVDSITEIYLDSFVYPNSAMVRADFSSAYFAQLPKRTYDTELLKVKIPSNYNPIQKTYTSDWDGTFASEKQWTDNPAWCFYDLLTNNRYGLGLYLEEANLDKWTLYEIGRYCDTLVHDGFGGLEPRFTCNLLINSQAEAYKVVNDLSSIFRAMTYYAGGSIFAVQDSPKDPKVYFTNANVEDGNFNYSSSSRRVRHTTAIVRYNDKNNMYLPAIEYIEDIEGIKKYGIRQVDLTAFGCTSKGQAHRYGKWALTTERLETETINFTAGLDAMYLRPGDTFGVYDEHRKVRRLGGRTFQIYNSGANGIAVLDEVLSPSLEASTDYVFTAWTPSYYYDPTQITDLDSADYENIRRGQIQQKDFQGSDVDTVNDERSRITFAGSTFDDTNYIVTGNLVWTIGLTEDTVSDFSQHTQFIDKSYDYYRTINIREQDENKFQIVGIQYNGDKYSLIETGVKFDEPEAEYKINPAVPDYIYAIGMMNSQRTSYTHIDWNYSASDKTDIDEFHIFCQEGIPFSGPEVPTAYDHRYVYQVNQKPEGKTMATEEDTTYYYRVYSYNAGADLYSNGYASTQETLTIVRPIRDFNVYGLRLTLQDEDTTIGASLTTGYYDLTSATTQKQRELYWGYSGTDPQFTWEWSRESESPYAKNTKFNVSYRPHSYTTIPDSTIYFQETITPLNEILPEVKFDFNENRDLSSGPYRNYDVVVQAVDPDTNDTSAGNNLDTDPNSWSIANGYDIMYCSNPYITGFELYTGLNTQRFRTTQNIVIEEWREGNIALAITSGWDLIPKDLERILVVAWTGEFVGSTWHEITGYVGPCEDDNVRGGGLKTTLALGYSKVGHGWESRMEYPTLVYGRQAHTPESIYMSAALLDRFDGEIMGKIYSKGSPAAAAEEAAKWEPYITKYCDMIGHQEWVPTGLEFSNVVEVTAHGSSSLHTFYSTNSGSRGYVEFGYGTTYDVDYVAGGGDPTFVSGRYEFRMKVKRGNVNDTETPFNTEYILLSTTPAYTGEYS